MLRVYLSQPRHPHPIPQTKHTFSLSFHSFPCFPVWMTRKFYRYSSAQTADKPSRTCPCRSSPRHLKLSRTVYYSCGNSLPMPVFLCFLKTGLLDRKLIVQCSRLDFFSFYSKADFFCSEIKKYRILIMLLLTRKCPYKLLIWTIDTSI